MFKFAHAVSVLLASVVGTSLFANAACPPKECPEKPVPTYNIDFTDPKTEEKFNYELFGDARIESPAPEGVARALRIDAFASYANLPGVNISPSKMKDCTLAIGIYLERILEDSKGWILTHDNGQFDRAVVLHDDRFNGLGISTGQMFSVYPEKTLPETKKWIQIVATFRSGGESSLFVDGVKAPISAIGQAGEGNPDFQIGQPRDYPENHDSDSWVRDVQIYDRALSDEEVVALFCTYENETCPLINCGGGITAHSCEVCPSSTDGALGCAGDCIWDKPPAECVKVEPEGSSVDCGGHHASDCGNCDASSENTSGCDGDCGWDVTSGTCLLCSEEKGNCASDAGECEWDEASGKCMEEENPEPTPVPAPTPAPKPVPTPVFTLVGNLKLKKITVSNHGDHVWGVTPDNKIYYRPGYEGHWRLIPGSLKHISVSSCGNHVWGVDYNNYVYYRAGLGNPNQNSWRAITGTQLKQISAVSRGGSHVWGVDYKDQVWHRRGVNGTWKQVGGKKMKYVAVEPNADKVYGLDPHLYVYSMSGRGSDNTWKWESDLLTRFKHISVSSNSIATWGANSSNGVHYKQIGVENGKLWTLRPDRLKLVETSDCGQHIWGIDADNKVYYLRRYGKFWKKNMPN